MTQEQEGLSRPLLYGLAAGSALRYHIPMHGWLQLRSRIPPFRRRRPEGAWRSLYLADIRGQQVLAETQAMAIASASQLYSIAIDAALAVQSNAETIAGHAFAHTRNALIQQYSLAMEDAEAEHMKAYIDASTLEMVTNATAAATAWTNSAVAGDPYSAYYAAYNAAQYTYNATVTAIYGDSWKENIDAQTQWVQDVASGWLTYWNDLANHSKTTADAITVAAQQVTDTLTANAYTFAETVAPAIKAAADAEVNNGYQAIQSAAGFAETYTNSKITNALTLATAHITAQQTLLDTEGDIAEDHVNQDAAAGIALAGVNAGLIGQLVSPAQLPQAQAQQENAPQPPQMTKEEFNAKLKQIVDIAKLDQRNLGTGKLYFKDASKEGGRATPGIDCEDIADALQRFLTNHFSKNEGVKTSILAAGWVDKLTTGPTGNQSTGRNNGHAFLIVEHGGLMWFVNQIKGITEGPFANMDELRTAVEVHIIANYPKMDNQFPITFTGPFADLPVMVLAMPAESEPWYKSASMRQRFADYLRSERRDPKLYFPQGVTPPEPSYWLSTQPFMFHP